MDKLKLKWKIFIFLLGFCILLLTILWIFQTVFLSDMYKFVRKVEIEKAISLVEKNINSSSLKDILFELETTKEITVKPTQDFAPPPPLPLDHVRHGRKPEAITKVHEYTLDDGNTISLTFYAMITPVEATVSTLQIQLLIITGIMVLLATIMQSSYQRVYQSLLRRLIKVLKCWQWVTMKLNFMARVIWRLKSYLIL